MNAIGTFSPTRAWLQRWEDTFDVVHVHWPEWQLRSEPAWVKALARAPFGWRLRRTLRGVLPWLRIREYEAFVRAAAASGKLIVWTCHNLEPHEGSSRPFRSACRVLARYADLVICHDEEAAKRCRSRNSPTGQVIVMPFGNFKGVFPPPRPSDGVLASVGVRASVPVLLCVGQLRPYKGTDIACEAAAKLGEKVSLVIAGTAPIRSYYRQLKGRVDRLPHAVLLEKRLSDQEFADLVHASDVVLLPYRTATGSSAVMAALTLSRGVVTSDLPFFVQLLRGAGEAGRVFAAGSAAALAQTTAAYLRVPRAERNEAARRFAARFDWPDLVAPVVKALHHLPGAGRRRPSPRSACGL